LGSRINQEIECPGGQSLHLREATLEDQDEIKLLYYQVYGGSYTLPEITNSDKMKWAINDPNYLWILGFDGGQLVSSVIFVVDSKQLIGKTFAGVVLPEYRGNKILSRILKRGMDYLMQEENLCETLYGVVRTFASKGFHNDLYELGFIDLGIFPNVRKIKRYETHSLKVCYKPQALLKRKKNPVLIPSFNQLYQIVGEKMELDQAQVLTPQIKQYQAEDRLGLLIERGKDVEWEYYSQRDHGDLLLDFFPFHYPEVQLYSRDRNTQVFLFYQEKDEYGAILGVKSQEENLSVLLGSICDYAESIGIKYLELLLPAYDPVLQQIAYKAGFLPSAYYPAMRLNEKGEREDYVVTSRSFVALNVNSFDLTAEGKPYLWSYCKIYTEKLWEDMKGE